MRKDNGKEPEFILRKTIRVVAAFIIDHSVAWLPVDQGLIEKNHILGENYE